MTEAHYTGDGSMPNLVAWSEQCTPVPIPRDPIAFSIWEQRTPLPPLSRRRVWHNDYQRENFITNYAALSADRWHKAQANEESAMWRLTFGGDPTLYQDICRRRREEKGQ